MKSSDPMRASARAEINIYDTLDAVEHFAANYPAERIDIRDANRLLRAAALMIRRAAHARIQAVLPPGSKLSMPVADAHFGTITNKHFGRIPPVDPALQTLLDNLKNNTAPTRYSWKTDATAFCDEPETPETSNRTIG